MKAFSDKIVYRLMQDWNGLFEGSCISEDRYKSVFYLDKCLYEPVREEDFSDWVIHDDANYRMVNNLECLLFYTKQEEIDFVKKLKYAGMYN